MARKYRLNTNGSPLTGVNFNGAAWQGNLNANGVEVSYEDTPYVPPPIPVPVPDTEWTVSGPLGWAYTGGGGYSIGSDVKGPLTYRAGVFGMYAAPIDCYPGIFNSGSLIVAAVHNWGGYSSSTTINQTFGGANRAPSPPPVTGNYSPSWWATLRLYNTHLDRSG